MTDGRKQLKAHWPPRRIQTVQVQLNADLYGHMYHIAKINGRSLAEEIRTALELRVAQYTYWWNKDANTKLADKDR